MKRQITPALYAHRGFHRKPGIPENSLPAFRRAIRRGWGAELDVHLLKDGTLAVFHDSALERCTGTGGILEDLDLEEMGKLRLEGTQERIPTLDQVLELFEGSGCPLIIEMKPYRGNHKALSEAVCRRMDRYGGEFCLESFDPRAVLEVKKLRPSFIRGQLAMVFERKRGLTQIRNRLSENLCFNVLTKPDFVAYRFEDRDHPALRRAKRKGVQEVSWTIRRREDLETARNSGAIVIFEGFDPEGE